VIEVAAFVICLVAVAVLLGAARVKTGCRFGATERRTIDRRMCRGAVLTLWVGTTAGLVGALSSRQTVVDLAIGVVTASAVATMALAIRMQRRLSRNHRATGLVVHLVAAALLIVGSLLPWEVLNGGLSGIQRSNLYQLGSTPLPAVILLFAAAALASVGLAAWRSRAAAGASLQFWIESTALALATLLVVLFGFTNTGVNGGDGILLWYPGIGVWLSCAGIAVTLSFRYMYSDEGASDAPGEGSATGVESSSVSLF